MKSRIGRFSPAVAAALTLLAAPAFGQDTLRAPDGRAVALSGNAAQPDLSAYRSPLRAKVVERRWFTSQGMYLANEEYYSGIPFFQRWIRNRLPLSPDPAFSWITNREAYWYSRYILSFVFGQSHLGVSMVQGPYWTLKAREYSRRNRLQRDRGERVWANKDILLGFYLPLYYKRTGWPRVFDDGSPTYLQYASGNPHFTGPIVVEDDFNDPQSDKRGGWGVPRYFLDWRHTRWNHDGMDTRFDMGGVGQTVKKQLVWATYFLQADHRAASPSDPSVQVALLGNDAEEGFRGVMNVLAGFNALLQVKAAMFADDRGGGLGGIDPFGYDPGEGLRYLPHEVAADLTYVGDLPERLWALDAISDDSSQLWDQASWLWATSEYEGLVQQYGGRVFTDNPPVDGGIIERRTGPVARGLSNVFVKNLSAMHTWSGILVSEWTSDGGTGKVLHMKDAALAIVALEEFLHRREITGHDPEVVEAARAMLEATASFLLRSQADDGGFGRAYDVESGRAVDDADLSTPQWFAIRALLSAHSSTDEPAYLQAARRTWNYLEARFRDEASGLYRDRPDGAMVTLTPLKVAAAMGALRELALSSPARQAAQIRERYVRWFVQAVDNSGFQMSEDDDTGELHYGKDGPDLDADGIPFLGKAHGRYGIAPLPAAQVFVSLAAGEDPRLASVDGESLSGLRPVPVKQAYRPAPGGGGPILFGPDLTGEAGKGTDRAAAEEEADTGVAGGSR